jgi:hypothetical protein
MTNANSNLSAWFRGARVLRAALKLSALVALLLLLAALAQSHVPERGAGLFGGMVERIKGHPRATIVLSLCAGASLWVGVGLLVAIQESIAARRKPAE